MFAVKGSIGRVVDVHSLHKSGTMFLFKFFQHLAKRQNAVLLSENHDPPDDCYGLSSGKTNDVSNGQAVGLQKLLFRCPLRTFEVDDFRLDSVDQRRIFHLRDPRDILVSEYYSFGWIHSPENIPLEDRRREIQEMSVDEYVILQSEQSEWPVDEKYEPLIDYEFDPKYDTVLKYEQMVTKFPRWCYRAVKACGISYPKLVTARLAWRYRNEFKTSGERMTHKRRITPGDFRNKLHPYTIEILNERFEPILERFGYRP